MQPMQGTLRIVYTSLAALVAWPGNPKRHADHELQSSIRRFGYTQPILVDETTGRMVAGHGRLAACQVLREAWLRDPGQHPPPAGIKIKGQQWLLPVLRGLSFASEGEALAYVLADNQLTIAGGWDPPDLSAALRHLQVLEIPIADLGWAEDALKGALAGLASLGGSGQGGDAGGGSGGGGNDDPGPQVDRAAELQKKWKTASGQLFLIPSLSVPGKQHRLLVGDCRVAADVARVLGGQRINVAFTSPPYASQRRYDEASGFKPIPPDKYVEWFEAVQANVRLHLADDGSWFVNIKEPVLDGERHLYVKDLVIAHRRSWGWLFKEEFAWTHHGIPGRIWFNFKNQFEPIFQFCTKAEIKIRPDNVSHQSENVPQGGGSNMADKQGDGTGSGFESKPGMAYPGNVISAGKNAESLGHAAAFPVALPTFFIKAYSDAGDTIYEPFSGSGTTLVAAEREGRVGHGIEISPAYVAVTLERLAGIGLQPRLET